MESLLGPIRSFLMNELKMTPTPEMHAGVGVAFLTRKGNDIERQRMTTIYLIRHAEAEGNLYRDATVY